MTHAWNKPAIKNGKCAIFREPCACSAQMSLVEKNILSVSLDKGLTISVSNFISRHASENRSDARSKHNQPKIHLMKVDKVTCKEQEEFTRNWQDRIIEKHDKNYAQILGFKHNP